MFKQITLTAMLIVTTAIVSTAQPAKNLISDSQANRRPEELLVGTEAIRAIARFGDFSAVAVRGRLQKMRQPAYLPGTVFVNKIVELKHLPIVDNKRVEKLKVALQPVLAYHGRNQMPIYVLWSEQPKAYLVERAVIIITTRMMMTANDEEIRGIVAHELAHEYVWVELIQARDAKDVKLMRECEMFCDAVAAFTLKEIGDNPASYTCVLERLIMIGIVARSTSGNESDTHPSLDTRKKLNKFLCQRLE